MDILLWVLQVLLGLVFLAAGSLKATQPIDSLKKQMEWVTAFPVAFVRFIGLAEVLGAIGLIIPALTKILSWLTPVAALGLAILMAGAVVVHLNRKEYNRIAPSAVLFVLSVIIMVGRFWIQPISG